VCASTFELRAKFGSRELKWLCPRAGGDVVADWLRENLGGAVLRKSSLGGSSWSSAYW